MKPNKFKKICKKYFATDSNFTIETNTNEDSIAISVFFCGYGVLRYFCSTKENSNEKPYILLADKFKYSEDQGKVMPCRNDGTFIGLWLDYTKLYDLS